jgi:methylase of polypeptide subunit release factors
LTEGPGELSSTVCLVPHDDLLVAADGPNGGAGADLVPGVQPPSYLLGCLTIRLPVERALDLGTGCGIQALLLSSLADEVIATDVSERALQYAELNAALNDRPNIDFRLGDLFDPVKGETFGVVVANPPYVISPDTVFTYRDSARGGEQIAAEAVEGAGRHLGLGGHATVLASWDASGPDPLERPRSWIPPGCDALILGSGRDVERNAELWNIGPDRDDAVDRWIAYFEQQRITQVGYGAVVLRRRDADAPVIRSIETGDQIDRPAGRHLLRLLDARDVHEGDRVRMVNAARLIQRQRLEGTTWVSEDVELYVQDGLGFRITLDDRSTELVQALDGRPLSGMDHNELDLVDRLVSLGYAELLT